MNECPICLESCNCLVDLECNHSFCRDCLLNWNGSCPICRRTIIIGPIVPNIRLRGLEVSNIRININSPKGTSLPIEQLELDVLHTIFGSLNKKNISDLNIFDKTLIQDFKGNCWWVGVIISKDDNILELEHTIFLKRNGGSIFRTSPRKRSVYVCSEDSLFVLL